MTRAGTTLVIIWEERSACVVGMEEAALGTASRGMTRNMDISTAIKREISYVCETGKGQPVRSVSETTTALGVLRTVCLRITRTKDITSKYVTTKSVANLLGQFKAQIKKEWKL